MRDVESQGPRLPGRREFLALGIGGFVVASLPRALRPARRLVRRRLPVMGTVADIAIVTRDPRWAQGAIDAAFAELRRVERTMTRFRSDSDIGRANAGAHEAPVVVGAATLTVVEEALRWAQASGGLFDPALARAVELWGVDRRSAPPPLAAVRQWAGRGLWRAVEPVRSGGQPALVFHDHDAALDLGGIAKGHGVDAAVEALRRWGVTDALVNVGGDLYALGRSAEGDSWQIGVRDPDDPLATIVTLMIEDRAVATSGDYEQFFVHCGRRYHHILDPRTGEPRRTERRSVTVAGATCMAADAAGTAVFGLDRTAAERILAGVDRTLEIVHIT